MVDTLVALGIAAPYYNLALVVVIIILFAVLFRTPSAKAFMKPWYLFFICICIFIVEEILTVLRAAGVTVIPQYFNAFFELAIITIFIYIVLLQKEHVKKHHS
jgi:hypothetical protein